MDTRGKMVATPWWDRLIPWRRRGAEPGVSIERVALSDLPTWQALEEQSQAWPLGYRTMLTAEPLSGPELYVERAAPQEMLQAGLERWQGDQISLVALVGPDGVGRTTMLNWFESHLPIGINVTRINIIHRIRSVPQLLDWFCDEFHLQEPVAEVGELIEQLIKLPPRVVLVDDLQRLVLRAIGTSRVVHTLLAILLGTQRNFLWVVACRDYGWRLLDYQFGIARYFTHLARLTYFSHEEFSQAMRLRLAASGLPQLQGEEGSEFPLLERRRMDEFMAASGGSMRTALFYWQISSDYDPEQGMMQVRHAKGVELASLREKGDLDLFTLAEILSNGGLTVEEHAEVFQRDMVKSRVVLEHLHQLRLLERCQREEGGVVCYQIDPVFYLPVSSMLEAAHALY